MQFEKLKDARKQMDLTQEQLAKMLGVKRAVISKYENGTIIPKIDMLQKIADVLRIPISYFFTDKEIEEADIVAKMEEEIKELQKMFALACRTLSDTVGCPQMYIEDVDIPDCDENGEECRKEDQWECWQRYIREKVKSEDVCRVCGCTWNNACPGGCWWVEEDLCSSCAEKMKNGSREI